LARWERIALPSELAVTGGSWLDPKSLQQEERDHLVIRLALRRLRRRTVIAPRSASIQMFFTKAPPPEGEANCGLKIRVHPRPSVVFRIKAVEAVAG
jgi:hypothetical protein